MNRILRVIVLASFLFLLPTVVLVAQSDLTLEDIAEALAELTDRVDNNDDRLSALETRTAPTPTPVATPTATPVPVPETVLVVTIASGNVRAGPGTQHAIVGSVSQGDTLEGPYEETGGWYQFCCIESGERAWISSTLVSVRDEGELTDWENARRDAVEVDPDTLLRYNADYVGELVYFSNIRVFQGADDFVLVFLDASFDYVGFLIYENASPRVLKDDRIDFVARVDGIHTYQSTGDHMISAPLLEVVELRLTN